jgi:hypothetical protein
MAETGYEAQSTVLRLALPDAPGDLAEAADRLAALTAGSGALQPEGTEWIDIPR